MSALVNEEKTRNKTSSLLPTIAVVAGAAGSLGFLLNESKHTPVLLLLLFIGWVLSPFTALLVAILLSKRWSDLTRATIYWLALIITLGSLVTYSRLLTPLETRPAALFLFAPLISWLLMGIVIPIAALQSGRKSRQSNSD